MNRRTNLEITLDDSQVLKGIAIIAMLCWHLFYAPNPVNVNYGKLAYSFGLVGDVCVSLFLLVSGYGLTKSFIKIDTLNPSNSQIFRFVLRRLVKFYSNFWVIFVVFVPIGSIYFGRALFTDNIFFSIYTLLLNLFGGGSFNEAWWYNGLIVVFYIFFPLFYYAVKYTPLLSLISSFFLYESSFWGYPTDFGMYLFIFLFGIYYALNNSKISDIVDKTDSKVVISTLIFVSLLGYVLLWILDNYNRPIFRTGIRVYNLFTIVISFFVPLYLRRLHVLYKMLTFVGEHSANIFWVHSFFYYYWFPSFFFSFKYGLVPFMLLLLISILVSVILEKMKTMCGFYIIQNRILSFINNK